MSVHSLIDKIRQMTPLAIREKIGPVIARIFYFFNFSIHLNRSVPKVLSIDETIDKIKQENLSVIRFGDGEVSLIDGLDLGFQKRSDYLVGKLAEILQVQKVGLLICIPGIWGNLNVFLDFVKDFNIHHLYRFGHVYKQLLVPNQVYGDTHMTRFYLAFKDRSHCGQTFKKLFSIWENKDVVLIEGEKSRLGVGNDMFSATRSLRRILCPPENAFAKYEAIKNEALKINKDALVLVSLGPTAKVLAYDLFTAGYRVIDVGHIDMEYEMFLRQADRQEKVAYKYFNEIQERNPEDCNDPAYISQIIAVIK